jgi:hypothetical protein
VRVVQVAVRAGLHRVAPAEPVRERPRLGAVGKHLEQAAVHDHLVDEEPIPDAGDPVGCLDDVRDDVEVTVLGAAPHQARVQVGDVHRAVGGEREIVR